MAIERRVIITGKFPQKREYYKDLINEQDGSTVATAFSSSTTHLLVGDDPGPSKLKMAIALGVELINEKQLHEMYGETMLSDAGTKLYDYFHMQFGSIEDMNWDVFHDYSGDDLEREQLALLNKIDKYNNITLVNEDDWFREGDVIVWIDDTLGGETIALVDRRS